MERPELDGATLTRLLRRLDWAARGEARPGGRKGEELTPIERRTLAAASYGLTQLETALVYGVSETSVNTALARARRVLRAKTTAHAVAIAFRRNLLS